MKEEQRDWQDGIGIWKGMEENTYGKVMRRLGEGVVVSDGAFGERRERLLEVKELSSKNYCRRMSRRWGKKRDGWKAGKKDNNDDDDIFGYINMAAVFIFIIDVIVTLLLLLVFFIVRIIIWKIASD
uniref:Transmembrane protein n=1 Tax=Syphacia muris TaxID=451379 RepID=A0A0N5AEC8_9BILA